MKRQDGYEKLFKAGKIDGFEFFMLWDPFGHVACPELNPVHPNEVEFQKVFSALLDRFFEQEAPGLSEDRIQERLDEIIREEWVKSSGKEEPWALFRRSKAAPKG